MKRFVVKPLALLLSAIFLLSGCSQSASAGVGDDGAEQGTGTRDPVPVVLTPTADGTESYTGSVSIVDASNSSEGYVMLQYTGSTEKVKIQISHNGGEPYTYDVTPGAGYEVFPLSPGSGAYTITVNENIEGTSYAVVDTAVFEATLSNDYSTFLYPNQYVNFTQSTEAIGISEELATGSDSDLDVVTAVYDYVVDTIEYDFDLAATVSTFYLPNLDATMQSKKGLCFDYAALMTAMLRAQRIPTQLVIGYAGDVYHAWISVYTDETGWIHDIIQFDGEEWVRMDPTFAATGDSSPDIAQYVGDGTNYNALFFY